MIEQIRKINQVKNEKNIFYFYKQKKLSQSGQFFILIRCLGQPIQFCGRRFRV